MSEKNQKVVLVTGSSGDIGSVIAETFSRRKYFVLGVDEKQNTRTKTDAFIRQNLQLLAEHEEARMKFRKKLDSVISGKTLSVVINNAAVQIVNELDILSPDDFIKTLHVNTVAPFMLVRICLDRLKESRGHIINIGSVHAQCSKPGFVAYATSKAALAGLTRSLAVELGDSGIKVNCIQPGAVETGMLIAGFENKPDRLAELKECIPVGHIGRPKDIAALALYLAEQKNGYISGATIPVDGGISSRLHDPD